MREPVVSEGGGARASDGRIDADLPHEVLQPRSGLHEAKQVSASVRARRVQDAVVDEDGLSQSVHNEDVQDLRRSLFRMLGHRERY